MNLSISSFNNNIVKSIFFAALLFILYTIFLFIKKPQPDQFQNPWVKNFAKAQDYIYADKKPEFAIVGSSLSARLDEFNLDNNVLNLAFAGGSPFEGMFTILKSGKKYPDMILIETNCIEQSQSELKEMIPRLFTPYVGHLKKFLPSLQEKYQPVNVLLSLISDTFGPTEAEKLNEKPNEKILSFGTTWNLNFNNRMTEHNIIRQSQASMLKNVIAYFHQKKVKIVFFRMPVHPKIAVSYVYRERAFELKQIIMGIDGIYWLPEPKDEIYETTDGIHLTYRSAKDYSKELMKYINQFSFRAYE